MGSIRFGGVRVTLLAATILTVAGCGGDAGTTSISGPVAPPVAPAAAPPLESASSTAPTNMLLPPGAPPTNFPAIAQSMNYTFGSSSTQVDSLSFNSLDLAAYLGAYMDITTPFPGDTALGEPNTIQILTMWGASTSCCSSTLAVDSLGSLPAFSRIDVFGDGSGFEAVEYVMPYSATANPAGYTYQTFGNWLAKTVNIPVVEGYFSAGIPTAVGTMPVTGSATYSGKLTGSFVDAMTKAPYDVLATVNVTVDFAARTLTLSTTDTTIVLSDGNVSATPTADTSLTISGVLSYSADSNTFTGQTATPSGMRGNATGRFYGAVTSASAASKPAGSPPEIGGTFAVMLPGVGAMQGAFGND